MVVNDPTHQVGGGVLIPVLDEEELLNADPKLLEMLAEINCLNTNFTLSLAGDRHPEGPTVKVRVNMITKPPLQWVILR